MTQCRPNIMFTGIYDDDGSVTGVLSGAALLVGYGTEQVGNEKVDYWLLRYSSGTDWGEKGYMKMIRGKNMAGVAKGGLLPFMDCQL